MKFNKTLMLIEKTREKFIPFKGNTWPKEKLYTRILKLQEVDTNICPEQLFDEVNKSIKDVENFSKEWNMFWKEHKTENTNKGNLNRRN